MDAAERRIRKAGYNGFSFREIAVDVGVKNASVHHHFATKEVLAGAVARRYAERFERAVEKEEISGNTRDEAWHRVFRNALLDDGQMCLCGVLGAVAASLPAEVATEARQFFERGLDNLVSGGLSRAEAAQIFSTLEGAMLLATAFGDLAMFDLATTGFATRTSLTST
ncbi:TetR/AcrR family transcriptional regulator [Beijerinckia sp. L45]|uniref:TetR/AcrR family transcriptional regulator n=1 Tax=Beijerinckia sp. L45 TaxID=1641855 RepID=UPI001FED730F|nr:TetR/AcrR family transcriptional regulator [Beijerinckia sp. L45]